MANNVYVITTNGQEVEIEWIARNLGTKAATNVLGQFTIPTGLTYVSNTVAANNGIYNAGLALWTIGTLQGGQVKTIKIKYSVDALTSLNLSVKLVVTLTETDVSLANNNRTVYFIKAGDQPCNPEAFITPAIQIVNDELYERYWVGENDSVTCTCCNKTYQVVAGSSVNITVVSITADGWANIVRTNPKADSYFSYNVYCDGCPDGVTYTSATPATVKINKVFTGRYMEYEGVLSQYGTSAPVVAVIENGLSGPIVWTRESTGSYLGTLASTFIDSGTTFYATLPSLNTGKVLGFSRLDNNTVRLTNYSTAAADYVDFDLSGVSIWIKVNIPAIVPSVSVTATVSVTPTITVSSSTTPSISRTSSVTPTITVSGTRAASISLTASISITSSVTPSITRSLSLSSSITVSITVSSSMSLSSTTTSSVTPTITRSISVSS